MEDHHALRLKSLTSGVVYTSMPLIIQWSFTPSPLGLKAVGICRPEEPKVDTERGSGTFAAASAQMLRNTCPG